MLSKHFRTKFSIINPIQLVTIYPQLCYWMEKTCGGLRREIVAYILEDIRPLTTRLARCPAPSLKIRFRIFRLFNRRYFSSLLFLFRLLLLLFRSAQFLFPISHTEFGSYQYDQTTGNDRFFLMGVGKLPPARLSIPSAIVLERIRLKIVPFMLSLVAGWICESSWLFWRDL